MPRVLVTSPCSGDGTLILILRERQAWTLTVIHVIPQRSLSSKTIEIRFYVYLWDQDRYDVPRKCGKRSASFQDYAIFNDFSEDDIRFVRNDTEELHLGSEEGKTDKGAEPEAGRGDL